MPHAVTIPDDLFARLQKHAVPLVDTLPTVIERALVALEAGQERVVGEGRHGVRTFNPAAPPNLAHTTPQRIVVEGTVLPKAETYWNPLMFAVIRAAAARGAGRDRLLELIAGNCVAGVKEHHGYKHLADLGVSVQGRDANAAWKVAYRVATGLGLSVSVEFIWQNTEKAAMPNTAGLLSIEG